MKGKNIKISSLYGKLVESKEGKRGYVISVNGLNYKLTCIICADENENRFVIPADNILRISENIIFKEGYCSGADTVPIRLGKACFDGEGNYLGALTEITFNGDNMSAAYVGRKKYPVQDLAFGDAVIVKRSARKLLANVEKDGKILLKRGTALTPEVLEKARENGEYIQTNLKSL